MTTPLLLPGYMTGKHVIVAGIQGLQSDVFGNISYGQSTDLHPLGIFDEVRLRMNLVDTNIKPTDGKMANSVPLYDDFTIEIGEIKVAGFNTNLFVLYGTYYYYRVEWQHQFPGNAQVARVVVIAGRSSLEDGVVEDKNADILVGKAVGVFPWIGYGTPPF